MSKTVRIIYYAVVTIVLLIALYKVFFAETVDVVLGINEGLVLTFGSVAIWITASLIHTFTHLKKSTPAIIGAGVLIAIFVISYLSAAPVLLDKFPGLSETTGKLASGGLVTVYILGAIAVLGALYSEVATVIKS